MLKILLPTLLITTLFTCANASASQQLSSQQNQQKITCQKIAITGTHAKKKVCTKALTKAEKLQFANKEALSAKFQRESGVRITR